MTPGVTPPSSNKPISVVLFGTPNLIEKLNVLKDFSKSPRFRAALEDAGQAYVLLAREKAPKASRTLVSSIGHEIRNFGTPEVQLRIGFDNRASRWARHVEFGTGPSSRVPRTKKYMHWFTDGPGGKTIQEPWGMRGQNGYTSNFAKWVMHPGTKAQPFFLEHLPNIRNRLIRALHRIMNEELNTKGNGNTPR